MIVWTTVNTDCVTFTVFPLSIYSLLLFFDVVVHCWDYRRLLVNKIGISLEDELKFSNDRLNANFQTTPHGTIEAH
ncbi:unnamed protein product [Acanthoscelides obtectus]|uniref:Uncharacterized protein n=1 Tax=Acanthoscelides obtectus TaxID=200917 RepID=A0A9P0MFU9_ACAOB|nr:unnamed protein product [Acanthoscelides obtectus]CAK1645930.1 hypothetical protein AOBTE_LOCUS14346 [Acanthoscelides obtectus]